MVFCHLFGQNNRVKSGRHSERKGKILPLGQRLYALAKRKYNVFSCGNRRVSEKLIHRNVKEFCKVGQKLNIRAALC